MTTAEAPTLRPTRASDRIIALDVARGLALFGIFMVNVQIMTQPIGWLASGEVHEQGRLAEILHYLTRVLFESKSYPLYSMLFGMGMALMYQRAKALNRPFAFPYLRRIILLAVFGLVHAILIWYGDILFHYFLIASVTMWLVFLRPRWLLTISFSMISLATLLLVAITLIGAAFNSEGAIPETTDATNFAEFWAMLKEGEIQAGPVDPAWIVGETDAFANGPFLTAIAMRTINWASGLIFWLVINGVAFHLAGMFLLGAAIMKANPFAPESRLPTFFIRLGLFVGLPLSAGAVLMGEIGGMQSTYYGLSAALTMVVGPCISLGYFGLAIRLAQSAPTKPLVHAIASAGRLGLTNYIMQSLVVAAIAQHWGLGLFGDVTRVGMVLIVLGVYAFQLLYSPLWLRVFTMGPLEYLWRTGIYLRMPKLLAPRRVATG